MSDRHLRSIEGGQPDQVARWRRLQDQYPGAAFAFADGWFYGALRDEDDVVREPDLEVMIDRLLAREAGEGRR